MIVVALMIVQIAIMVIAILVDIYFARKRNRPRNIEEHE